MKKFYNDSKGMPQLTAYGMVYYFLMGCLVAALIVMLFVIL